MKSLFEDVVIFHGLSDQQKEIVRSKLIQKKCAKDSWVVREGRSAEAMFVIVSGQVSIWKRRGRYFAGEKLGQLGPGDCFGEMCLIDCQARSASVRAETKLVLYQLPYMAMLDLFEQEPQLYGLLILNIAREISRRLRKKDHVTV